VGNRLNQTTKAQTTNYVYDAANRLLNANELAYQWDDNGNMLNDDTSTYTYNSSNRLIGVTGNQQTISYKYNGLGDRLQQISTGTATNYTVDINSGLTQVLDDGTNKYLYGNQRIAQIAPTQTGYFLADALGSMRQMTDSSADLTLAKSYDPYGNVVSSSGTGETVYGYTGEMQSNGLVYLRARDYASQLGRFTSRDTWEGNVNKPVSFNRWSYTYANPVNLIDPTGFSSDCAALGTCGPDVTEWFRGLMKQHYEYGRSLQFERTSMEIRSGVWPTTLSSIASAEPFSTITREFTIPGTGFPIGVLPLGISPSTRLSDIETIEALGVLEYAMYGLSVDYGRIAFNDCGPNGCGKPFSNSNPPVTLCGHCIDASDMGNIMFGLGGQSRGYTWPFVWGSAGLFNVLHDWVGKSTNINDLFGAFISPDGRGAIPGYMIGSQKGFDSESKFCEILNAYRVIGYNGAIEDANLLEPSTFKVNDSNIKHRGHLSEDPSYLISLNRWSDGDSTKTLLLDKLIK